MVTKKIERRFYLSNSMWKWNWQKFG